MKEFQQLDLLMSSVAIARHAASEPVADICSDTVFIARILLGLLQRGHSSILSPYAERCLLKRGYSTPRLYSQEDLDSELSDDLLDAPAFAEQLVGSLVKPELGVEYHALAEYDSDSEAICFQHQLSRLLKNAVSIVEPQRLLSTMIHDDDLEEEFVSQRVDFALQTPSGTKVVFEIDGRQHLEDHQLRLDQRRDQALRSAGWIVERILASDVFSGNVAFSGRVRNKVANDRTIALCNDLNPSMHKDPWHRDQAEWLVLAPHAIARIQLGVLLAMIAGDLSLDETPWIIGIVERDLPCGEIAIIDLRQQITQLCAIYGLDEPPDIDVAIARTHKVKPLSGRLAPGVTLSRRSSREIAELDASVIIDVSVRTRPADLRVDDPLPVTRFASTTVYDLRTAYRRLPETPLPWPAPREVKARDPVELKVSLTYFLQMLFRKERFRAKQLDIIARALQRRDVLGLLPTGGGKSLTFQLPTLLSPGLTIVVAPLKSLIDDQTDNLHRVGINRVVGLHSGQRTENKRQSLELIAQGHPRFLYIAPERFHIQAFRDELRASVFSRAICFAVIDEAHCVSEWGHDFRPAYLSVAHQARTLGQRETNDLPIIALTATASDTVLVDIQRELGLDPDDDATLVSIESFDRRELNFLPLIVNTGQTRNGLDTALQQISDTLDISPDELLNDPESAGIVFCRYVNGPFGVWDVRSALCARMNSDIETIRAFSGSRPKKVAGPESWDGYKRRVQADFKENRFPLLVATSSFGMGIDKRNICYTLHYGIPPSIEALAQEAGRAGLDKADAACAIVFTQQQSLSATRYLDPQLSNTDAKAAFEGVARAERDDTYRVMLLHNNSYPGVDTDLEQLRTVFKEIHMSWQRGQGNADTIRATIPRSRTDDTAVQKAIYRLSVLGAIVDYTVDYALNSIEVQSRPVSPEDMERYLATYITRYDTRERADTVLGRARSHHADNAPYDHVLNAICEFTYDVIERSRREALRNVVQRLEETQGG
jgi:ATP-dependent DNA helicase RecQ